MIHTHSLFHGVSPANLGGNLPYFFIDHFVRWYVSHPVTFFWTASLVPGKVQMLANHQLSLIHTWIKEIHVENFHYLL